MRAGGWTIKTTLDLRAQKIAEDSINVGREHLYKNGTDNLAMVSVDVETSQVVALVGSADFSNSTYGELNVATDALIEPGSSIKPILDYSPLFMEREGVNYGPGSILKDENIDKIYCGGSFGGCKLRNATYSATLYVTARLTNKETGYMKEQEVYMGEFPLMTPSGTFVINGAERVIVSQLVRSPGVYYKMEHDKSGKELFYTTVIPNRGAWLEYENDVNDVFYVRLHPFARSFHQRRYI